MAFGRGKKKGKKTTLILITILAVMPIITQAHADTETDFWLTHGEWIEAPFQNIHYIQHDFPYESFNSGDNVRKARGNFTAKYNGSVVEVNLSLMVINNTGDYETFLPIEQDPIGHFDYAFSIPAGVDIDFRLVVVPVDGPESTYIYNWTLEVWAGLYPSEVTTTDTEPTTNPTQRDLDIMILAVSVSVVGVAVIILALVVRRRT
jgi:hypothetical protein